MRNNDRKKNRSKKKRKGRKIMKSRIILKRVKPITYPILQGGGMSFFSSPVSYQRGRGGLGGILARVARNIIPFIRKPFVQRSLKKIGQQALRAGVSAVGQTLSDEPNRPTLREALKGSLKQEARELTKNLKKSLSDRSKGHSDTKQKNSIKQRRVAYPVIRQNSAFSKGRGVYSAKDIFTDL